MLIHQGESQNNKCIYSHCLTDVQIDSDKVLWFFHYLLITFSSRIENDYTFHECVLCPPSPTSPSLPPPPSREPHTSCVSLKVFVCTLKYHIRNSFYKHVRTLSHMIKRKEVPTQERRDMRATRRRVIFEGEGKKHSSKKWQMCVSSHWVRNWHPSNQILIWQHANELINPVWCGLTGETTCLEETLRNSLLVSLIQLLIWSSWPWMEKLMNF